MLEWLLDWLRANGVNAELDVESTAGSNAMGTDGVLRLCGVGGEHRFLVQRRTRSPYPNELSAVLEGHRSRRQDGLPLLSAPYVSEGMAQRLREAGWSWADDVGNLELRSEGLHLVRRVTKKPRPGPRLARVPRRGKSLAIVRFLISHGEELAWGPSHLASIAGVSQPRASQVLAALEQEGLVDHVGRGEWIARRDALLDAFLESYRGPGGTEVTAYSLDPPLATALRLVTAGANGVVISADVGPDLLVPLRSPTVLIVYTRQAVDLQRSRLVPTPSASEANVFIRTPDDRSVFGHHETVVGVEGQEVSLVDPTQLLWDLEQLGGQDRREAADEMRNWLLNR